MFSAGTTDSPTDSSQLRQYSRPASVISTRRLRASWGSRCRATNPSRSSLSTMSVVVVGLVPSTRLKVPVLIVPITSRVCSTRHVTEEGGIPARRFANRWIRPQVRTRSAASATSGGPECWGMGCPELTDREDTPVSVIIHPPTRPPDSNSMNAHKHDAYSISIEGLRASQLPESTSMEEQTTTITTIELALDLVFVATNAHLRHQRLSDGNPRRHSCDEPTPPHETFRPRATQHDRIIKK